VKYTYIQGEKQKNRRHKKVIVVQKSFEEGKTTAGTEIADLISTSRQQLAVQ
jgi:hypothetical protein